MASTEPVRISRAEELSRRLEQEIVDNGLPAGERLGTKEDIRNRFGYAVATVNEALRLLETRGLIEARPGPRRRHVRRLALLAGAAQPPGARLQGRRRPVHRLPRGPQRAGAAGLPRSGASTARPADAKALRRSSRGCSKQTDNPKAFLHLNWDLHRRMAKMGDQRAAEDALPDPARLRRRRPRQRHRRRVLRRRGEPRGPRRAGRGRDRGRPEAPRQGDRAPHADGRPLDRKQQPSPAPAPTGRFAGYAREIGPSRGQRASASRRGG